MSTVRGIVRAAALATALWMLYPAAPPARAEDPPPKAAATRVWGDADGKMKISFPAEWEVAVLPGAEDSNVVLDIHVDPAAPRIKAWGYSRESLVSARGELHYQLPHHIRNYRATEHALVLDAPPHLWTKTPDRNERHLMTITHAHRVPLLWVYEVPEELWTAVYPALVRAAATGDSALEDYPPRPARYKALPPKDGYVYLLHPGAKEKDVAAFHEIVKDAEADFVKDYGPVPDTAENPIEILFHDRGEDAAGVISGDAWSDFKIAHDPGTLRMVGVKAQSKSAMFRADTAFAVTRLLAEKLSGGKPTWFREAEPYAAWLAQKAGKPLPAVPEQNLERFLTIPPRFTDLAAPDHKATRESSITYLALFRCGAKKYQDAFAAFRAELQRTGDPVKAQERLLALDALTMQNDAGAFVSKSIKAVKGK